VIKVSVLYPNTAGCKFDMEYYLTRCTCRWCSRSSAQPASAWRSKKASPAARPGRLRPMSLWVISISTRPMPLTAFAPHAQSILADIPNYTNTQPTIQVSEVRL
jgi:hypothetical protein